jgi:single-stranded-DNA-specific exonuclease
VAYKLIHALFRERGRESQVPAFLKVVAIGTVADVAKLVGENRTIVALGLKDLAQAKNLGLRALMEVSGCGDGSGMRAYDLGFRIGPRINAAGRMDAARAVVELLDTTDWGEARRLAEHLDRRNQERKQVQEEIVALAVAELAKGESSEHSHVAVIAGEGWHRGVIGIAASKIAERINRPCVVIALEGEIGHGSARSIEAYHLLNGLTECADLFEKFGGHSHAAGITIRPDKVHELRRRLNAHAAACLTEADLQPCVKIDAELPAEAITFELANQLSALEPFGAGNPRPVFLTRNLRVISEPLVVKEQHLKMRLAGPGGRPLESIWWRGVEAVNGVPTVNTHVEMAYSIETNIWNNEIRLQLNVEDLRQAAVA